MRGWGVLKARGVTVCGECITAHPKQIPRASSEAFDGAATVSTHGDVKRRRDSCVLPSSAESWGGDARQNIASILRLAAG
eukprot:1452384-Amphidinium_carterae.1